MRVRDWKEVAVRVDPDTAEWLDARADELSRTTGLRATRTDVIRQAIVAARAATAANDTEPGKPRKRAAKLSAADRHEDEQARAALEIGESVMTTGKPVASIAEPRDFARFPKDLLAEMKAAKAVRDALPADAPGREAAEAEYQRRLAAYRASHDQDPTPEDVAANPFASSL